MPFSDTKEGTTQFCAACEVKARNEKTYTYDHTCGLEDPTNRCRYPIHARLGMTCGNRKPCKAHGEWNENCIECQFEKGHSQACSLKVDYDLKLCKTHGTMTNHLNGKCQKGDCKSQSSKEKEFDELYGMCHEDSRSKKFKSFISQVEQDSYLRGKREALEVIARGEGWEETEEYYKKVLGLLK